MPLVASCLLPPTLTLTLTPHPSWLREFGTPLPFYFPFTSEYWFGDGGCFGAAAGGNTTVRGEGLEMSASSATNVTDNTEGENFEPFTAAQRQQLRDNRCIRIRGLRREFDTPDGVKVAVNDLELTMFEGQIYVLLGHNGAGKVRREAKGGEGRGREGRREDETRDDS